jgi:hypothetical protein
MSNEPSQLNTDLAALLGFAVGNRTAAANAIKQAKESLSITKDTRSLSNDDRAAIVQWHKARLTDDNQLDIESIAPPVAINEPMETAPTHIEQVETIPPSVVETIADDTAPVLSEVETAAVNEAVALINAPLSELELLRIENAKLQARLEAVDHKAAPTYDFNETVRIAFYFGDKRTVIALSGFYLNALMLATGINKKGIPAWIKAAVDSWGAFDDKLNVTEQVKLLIVRELESQLIKARG